MDERNGNRCTGHGDVWAIAVFAKSCIDSRRTLCRNANGEKKILQAV